MSGSKVFQTINVFGKSSDNVLPWRKGTEAMLMHCAVSTDIFRWLNTAAFAAAREGHEGIKSWLLTPAIKSSLPPREQDMHEDHFLATKN